MRLSTAGVVRSDWRPIRLLPEVAPPFRVRCERVGGAWEDYEGKNAAFNYRVDGKSVRENTSKSWPVTVVVLRVVSAPSELIENTSISSAGAPMTIVFPVTAIFPFSS